MVQCIESKKYKCQFYSYGAKIQIVEKFNSLNSLKK